MLANNYFCTLNAKIMKGILPTYCRTMGYTLLILCVPAIDDVYVWNDKRQ